MLVQACLNGARATSHHPALPTTLDAVVSDAVACVAAGAGDLHIHARDADGNESLAHVDALIRAIRTACPGTLVGVSTGAWITGDVAQTRAQIAAWSVLPDHASVNLSEEDAPAIFSLLREIGVGIDAGLATIEDAERFVTLPERNRVFRVLYEIEDPDLDRAEAQLPGIMEVLAKADIQRSVLLHGFDDTVWHFVRRARDKGWSTRIGLEDGRLLEDGTLAPSNAALVADAMRLLRA